MAQRFAIVIAVVLALAGQQLASAQKDQPGPWKLGRATFYGKDGWSIHTGSCGYGYLDPAAGTGWDVAAMSDTNGDFQGACGKCKEVRCKTMWFRDGYGQKLEREFSCFDPDASVVVTITDTCPCQYPGNYYSNKRWCCGDMYHLDLSLWTFEKLADTKWGVMSVEWRDVPCWYRPVKRAKHPQGKVSSAERPAPRGWQASYDRRPFKVYGHYPEYLPRSRPSVSQERGSSGRKLRGVVATH